MTWLKTHDQDSIRWLTIDRPERLNAVPADGFATLRDAFQDFETSEARVLIITGAGGAFCAGADLDPVARAETTSMTARHRRMRVIDQTVTALHRTTKPTIAAVDGVAVGAGMNMALACDVVLASERARFSEIYVLRGLSVDFGGSWHLPRIVGLQRAKELVLSGRIVGAEEAVEIGLALEVVPDDELKRRAIEIAESFLKGAPIPQMFAKQMLNASFESSFSDAVTWEGQSHAIAFNTEDAAEGVSAFHEKRDPHWKGR